MTKILKDPTHIKIQEYLDTLNMDLKIIEFNVDTSTSELAAKALDVEVARIAKSLLLLADKNPVLVVTSGDMRIDQKKLKSALNAKKIKFADAETVLKLTGYPVGGVCPIGLSKDIKILLDISMDRFPCVYAAAGTPHSALPVTIPQLQTIAGGEVVDVCK